MVGTVVTEKDRALLVAKYFILQNTQNPKPTGLDQLKLQKLIYYAQAWNLVFNEDTLFENKIEAWVRGPVVPEVWRVFHGVELKPLSPEDTKLVSESFSNKEKEILDDVWQVYGKFDGPYLETLTHQELPWQEARKNVPEYEASSNVISIDLIQDYYTGLYKDAMAKSTKAS